MSLIQIKGLKKSFQGNEVIKGLDFKLEKGKCIALLGPNGAGKTTTLRMLSGLMKPTEGSISFSEAKKDGDIRHLIGYLPQFPVFYDWMSGFEFLQYAGKLAGLTSKEAKERSLELLELVGIIDAKNRRIGKYSGGMRQRLGIAQAIINRPQLVMLDEPVSALDPFGRREVLELLERLKKETTILFSTHILNDAEEVCDEIIFVHNGKIVESGTMDDLRERHQQAKIDLIFRRKTEEMESTFRTHSLTKSILVDGNRISVFVTNVESARKEFLRLISEKEWQLDKFEVSSMTLEDVFMKVVGK
ncbi:ABC transporter ATP-binding protein [Neobacillus sp. 179-C4.2 HS]|jgi:ABC-2 type transport system ATP-binding protein|uniref:ABC transporter ATP-binding protein n=1 Tax=Neobacillus driksii TaxID=3035913 RepID=A0ABV4YPU1_9BACI|nr:ABC transporter ATP-binding protein [Neobacillus sp. 179.-C4.2 HS]MDP5193617.1 ABC transporter ATP-binding protein [Neobacillus sp. 179.-C4.2 HS]